MFKTNFNNNHNLNITNDDRSTIENKLKNEIRQIADSFINSFEGPENGDCGVHVLLVYLLEYGLNSPTLDILRYYIRGYKIRLEGKLGKSFQHLKISNNNNTRSSASQRLLSNLLLPQMHLYKLYLEYLTKKTQNVNIYK